MCVDVHAHTCTSTRVCTHTEHQLMYTNSSTVHSDHTGKTEVYTLRPGMEDQKGGG